MTKLEAQMSMSTGTIDEEFLLRLKTALKNAPGLPEREHGRISWLMREIERLGGPTLTFESVRRWFTGRSKPRGENLEALCRVLHCHPAWLAFGTAPVGTRRDQVEGSARADGAVYLVLGRMLLDGISAALPAADDEVARAAAIDMQAIIGRRACRFTVSQAESSSTDSEQQEKILVARPRMPSLTNDHLVVVACDDGAHSVFHLPPSAAERLIAPRGDYGEIRLQLGSRRARLLVPDSSDGGAYVDVEAITSFSSI